jgi:tetratricopeptide (TPR) repeat protein
MSKTPHTLTVRPQQPLHLLLPLGFLLLGVCAAGKVYGRASWLFAALFTAAAAAFLADRIVFDGHSLRRRGLAAWIGSRFGLRHELAVGEIETITSYPVLTRGHAVRYRTLVCGAGVKWTISSRSPHYYGLIKSLFAAVSPHQLDPLSAELLAYWGEERPRHSFFEAAQAGQKVRRWRRLANSLSLDGHSDVAARYFRLAYETDPNNARLIYEMARFVRRNLVLQKRRAQAQEGRRAVERVEQYLVSAGRVAERAGDAAVVERVGETFFELRNQEQARQHFETAVRIESHRPRANIGLALMALQGGQVARAVHHYAAAASGAAAAGAESLARLAGQKADYYARLIGDDQFLSAESWRVGVLTQLKWGRRAALALFLAAWLMQLGSYQFLSAVHHFSREISATAAVMWIITSTASYLFSQRRS